VALLTRDNNKSLSSLLVPACATEQIHHEGNATTNASAAELRESVKLHVPAADDRSAINFRLQPTRFVQEMTSCFTDDDCHIYYYHFGKSGGTGFEERAETMFPPRLDSCCNSRLMKRFRASPQTYCDAKFSSYQVSSRDFLERIVPTCMSNNKTRGLILVSFREPLTRTLSYIHQMCNKNFKTRTPEGQQACRTCSYEKDKEFWNNLVQYASGQYQELYEVVATKIPNTQVLTVDLVDLSELYRDLWKATNHTAFTMKINANPEQTSRCNFGFKSEMFRGLRPASEIYRNMTLGIERVVQETVKPQVQVKPSKPVAPKN